MKKHGTKIGAESPAEPATAIVWYTREEWDARAPRGFVGAAELRTWCDQQGIPPNSKARSSYAAQKLRNLREQKPDGAA